MVTMQKWHECERRIPGRLIVVSSVRYAIARRINTDGGSRRTAQCDLVEITEATMDSSFARTRGTRLPSPDSFDRGTGRRTRCCFHSAHRALWRTTVPSGWRGLAAAVGSSDRLPGGGLSALPLLSGCSRQWCSTNESRLVCARRANFTNRFNDALRAVSDLGS